MTCTNAVPRHAWIPDDVRVTRTLNQRQIVRCKIHETSRYMWDRNNTDFIPEFSRDRFCWTFLGTTFEINCSITGETLTNIKNKKKKDLKIQKKTRIMSEGDNDRGRLSQKIYKTIFAYICISCTCKSKIKGEGEKDRDKRRGTPKRRFPDCGWVPRSPICNSVHPAK